MNKLINLWKNLTQCSTCEQLKNQIDMLRRDHDLYRGELIEEKIRLLDRIESLEKLLLPANQPDNRAVESPEIKLEDYEPIRGVTNPRRAIISIQRAISKKYNQKSTDKIDAS